MAPRCWLFSSTTRLGTNYRFIKKRFSLSCSMRPVDVVFNRPNLHMTHRRDCMARARSLSMHAAYPLAWLVTTMCRSAQSLSHAWTGGCPGGRYTIGRDMLHGRKASIYHATNHDVGTETCSRLRVLIRGCCYSSLSTSSFLLPFLLPSFLPYSNWHMHAPHSVAHACVGLAMSTRNTHHTTTQLAPITVRTEGGRCM